MQRIRISWLAIIFWCTLQYSDAFAQTCSSVTITSPSPTLEQFVTAQSCSGCDSSGTVEVTFTFADDVPCGTFVDGSPWIAVGTEGVGIVDIQPPVTSDCGADRCNGWMINPSSTAQAFDSRHEIDESLIPTPVNPTSTEPFVANAGMSILKSVSLQDEIMGDDCSDNSLFGGNTVRNCIYFYTVLTVLSETPPDGTGQGYFRPPFAGTDKPLIPISDARLDCLPRLPADVLDETPPDLSRSEEILCTTVVDYRGTMTSQYFKGFLNTGERINGYQGSVSRHLGDLLLRMLLEDRTDRMAYCAIQRGIDFYSFLQPPISASYNPNGGHGEGRTAWPYLAASLLDRSDWITNLDAMDRGRFAERSQVYFSPVADPDGEYGPGPGEVLYGAYPGTGGIGCSIDRYWNTCLLQDWNGSGCNKICADPFGFIDGGHSGQSYQTIFSPAALPYGLVARLVPSLGNVWPEDDGGHRLFLEYIDRWVEHGGWALPDPCSATVPEADPSSPEDCWNGPPGTCLCVHGEPPRYPDNHGLISGEVGGANSFTGAMWTAFRACSDDSTCDGMDDLCEEPVGEDAGPQQDGGPHEDGGPGQDSDLSSDGGVDSGVPDGGNGPAAEQGGCSCRSAGGGPSGFWMLLFLFLVLATKKYL